MPSKITKFKLPWLGITDKQYEHLPFGRQIEYQQQIAEWKKTAKCIWLSQKRRSWRSALSQFVKSEPAPREWFCSFPENDDTFPVYYTE